MVAFPLLERARLTYQEARVEALFLDVARFTRSRIAPGVRLPVR